MPAVILAGGLATRLRPLTETVPKALIEVNGQPFLHHQLALLKRSGIRHAVMLVGYLGEKIQEEFGDGSRLGVKLDYSSDARCCWVPRARFGGPCRCCRSDSSCSTEIRIWRATMVRWSARSWRAAVRG